jgi:hypothetical protein
MLVNNFKLPDKYKIPQKPMFGNFIKIKHNSKIERKEFIVDLIYVAVAKAILEVAVKQTFEHDPDIITIHRNKNRKEYKKIKEYLDYIVQESEKIYHRLESKDGITAQRKAIDLAVPFIKTMAEYKGVSLELLSINIFDAGLHRARKTKMNEVFKPFADYMFLYEKLGAEVEKAGIRESTLEFEIAMKFKKEIKY